ncbi:MAG: hypothetical protein FWF84_07135, partial [Kiritimatiellaeota bacterium]|nr:hypothetical protein [Kiritimatiellota bacterium]
MDDYKEWILEWEEDSTLARPRGAATRESWERVKANFEKWPAHERERQRPYKDSILEESWLVTGDPEKGEAEAQRAIAHLDGRLRSLGFFIAHNRQTQFDYDALFRADSALACPDLEPETRKALRAKIAAMVYMLTHPDYNPRGLGAYVGSANMPANRASSAPHYAVMIQDHPKAKEWLDEADRYIRWLVSFNVTHAGGTFRESHTYATFGPTLFLTTAAIALRNAGYDIDRFEPLKELGRYFAGISTPPTFPRGVSREDHRAWIGDAKMRVVPGLGVGGDIAGGFTQYLLANLFSQSDPAFASAMLASWEESGALFGSEVTHTGFWYYWDPAIKPEGGTGLLTCEQNIENTGQKTCATLITGFGGILRAHSDSPDETYVCLRQGYNQSHWPTDQGSFILYARGACLAPPTGFDYATVDADVYRHSLVCFGDPNANHEHGRVDTNIEDYGSTPSVGYLLGRQTFKKRWDKSGSLQNDFDWSRQVMLLRSERVNGANYVVVRDSLQGNCWLPSHWYQWLCVPSNNVTLVEGGALVKASNGIVMDVRAYDGFSPVERLSVTGTKVSGYTEDYSVLSIHTGVDPREGRGIYNYWSPRYYTVFYPRHEREPGIKSITRLAQDLVKIETPESTDYIFMNVDTPVYYRDDLIEIHAHAGAVRIFKDKVLLINASGQFGRIAYRGAVAEGLGPFEVPVKLRPAKGVTEAGRTLAPVAEPTGEAVYAFDGMTWAPKSVTKNGRIFKIESMPDKVYVYGDEYRVLASSGASVTEALNIQHHVSTIESNGLKGWIAVEGDKVTFVMAEGFGKVSYGDFYVKGEAPFTCVWEPGKITLQAEGRRRIFQMPIPENIVPPRYLPPKDTLPEDYLYMMNVDGWINWPWAVDIAIDGIPTQGGWYDGLLAFGLDDGNHTAVITPYTNPPVWPTSHWTRQLGIHNDGKG